MAAQLIEQARDAKMLREVFMTKTEIVRYGEDASRWTGDDDKKYLTAKYAIATEDLNACQAVAIISKKAAIMSHISPLSPNFPTGEQWAEYMMNCILAVVRCNKDCFPDQGSDGIVVFGIQGQEIKLESHVKLLITMIRKALMLNPQLITYPVLLELEHRPTNKGMVYIEGYTTGQMPIVWVEHRQVFLK
ncbi:MAG: hypothetical protein Q9168_004535 [Polycauliona sp. 1 TL-2023]